jgi:hypothetical protein
MKSFTVAIATLLSFFHRVTFLNEALAEFRKRRFASFVDPRTPGNFSAQSSSTEPRIFLPAHELGLLKTHATPKPCAKRRFQGKPCAKGRFLGKPCAKRRFQGKKFLRKNFHPYPLC